MSDAHQSTAVSETPAVDTPAANTTETNMEEAPRAEPTTDAPIAESMMKPTEPEIATESKDESAPTEEKTESAAVPEKKPVEPITSGQLALKGPGLLKSIIPSKKEFWLSDDAVTPQDLNSYMRGEKPDVAHPVVAWASQSGKGLLFFNKKGDTSRKTPSHVLALYDAVDLKKESPHEIAFKLNGQEHVLKATSDNERDGWYMSIEKAIEMGKAQKDEVRESDGYKAEMEKLNKPTVTAATAAAKQRSQSQPKKSTDVERSEAQRKNSDLENEEKKDKKSRSASRGVLDRLKSKKEPETKKDESSAVEEPKAEENKTDELVGAGAGAAGLVGGAAAVEGVNSADNEEKKKDETVESPVETKTEDKSKPAKRGSIFGKMQGWSSMKSPSKEKEHKDAELKPEVPPKDDAVAANPPQLPETTTTEPTETETQPETVDKKEELTTPSKERPGFLSGFSFGNKRNRSVSPSTPMKEPVKTEDAAPAEAPKDASPVEETKDAEPISEPTTVEPMKTEEPAKTDAPKTDATPNKRQSVLGNLGRRASKAFRGIQTPKKENTAPATQAKEETTEEPKSVEEPVTNGESKPAAQPQQIGDVVPDAIEIGKAEHQPAAVAASA